MTETGIILYRQGKGISIPALEKLIDFIRRKYPDALPRVRAEIQRQEIT